MTMPPFVFSDPFQFYADYYNTFSGSGGGVFTPEQADEYFRLCMDKLKDPQSDKAVRLQILNCFGENYSERFPQDHRNEFFHLLMNNLNTPDFQSIQPEAIRKALYFFHGTIEETGRFNTSEWNDTHAGIVAKTVIAGLANNNINVHNAVSFMLKADAASMLTAEDHIGFARSTATYIENMERETADSKDLHELLGYYFLIKNAANVIPNPTSDAAFDIVAEAAVGKWKKLSHAGSEDPKSLYINSDAGSRLSEFVQFAVTTGSFDIVPGAKPSRPAPAEAAEAAKPTL